MLMLMGMVHIALCMLKLAETSFEYSQHIRQPQWAVFQPPQTAHQPPAAVNLLCQQTRRFPIVAKTGGTSYKSRLNLTVSQKWSWAYHTQ